MSSIQPSSPLEAAIAVAIAVASHPLQLHVVPVEHGLLQLLPKHGHHLAEHLQVHRVILYSSTADQQNSRRVSLVREEKGSQSQRLDVLPLAYTYHYHPPTHSPDSSTTTSSALAFFLSFFFGPIHSNNNNTNTTQRTLMNDDETVNNLKYCGTYCSVHSTYFLDDDDNLMKTVLLQICIVYMPMMSIVYMPMMGGRDQILLYRGANYSTAAAAAYE